MLKVSQGGELSVLAGDGNFQGWGTSVVPGPALGTAFRPEHVAVTPDGAVYVGTNYQVLKIANGQVTVIAGTATPAR